MLEIPSIITINAEMHFLKLCGLDPHGYKVRDSNYFTCVYHIAQTFDGGNFDGY